MVECPKCHGSIEISEANFGTLFTCPLCRGLFFVGWDGQPEINNQIDSEPIDSEPIDSQPIDSQPMTPQAIIQTSDPLDLQHNHQMSGQFSDQLTDQPPLQPIDQLSDQLINQPTHQLGEHLSAQASVLPDLSIPDASAAIHEIERFANQNQEALPLSYDLSIGGLDLPKQIQLLREVLEDPRFGWDSEQILSQIAQGVLLLKNLSPIKTSLLVRRIKSSDLEIEWRQNVLS